MTAVHCRFPHASLAPPRDALHQEITRFLHNPLKPAILAMSRPDHKKNITTLVGRQGQQGQQGQQGRQGSHTCVQALCMQSQGGRVRT